MGVARHVVDQNDPEYSLVVPCLMGPQKMPEMVDVTGNRRFDCYQSTQRISLSGVCSRRGGGT